MITKISMTKNFLLTLIITFLFASPSFSAEETSDKTPGVVIQILNKTNANAEKIGLPLKREVDYSNLTIIAHRCWQAPLDQKPESKALIEVLEKSQNRKDDEKDSPKKKRIFLGWMFASSPSISSLEHPIYDITVINCKEVELKNVSN